VARRPIDSRRCGGDDGPDLADLRKARPMRLVPMLFLLLAGPAVAAEPTPAAPPLDAVAYTVVGTPPGQRVPLPEIQRDRNVRIGFVRPFPERAVSPLFWYDDAGVRYGLLFQHRPAPLVVLIPGTGSSYDSNTTRTLARVFYAAGLHVLAVPSPTHPNFIVNGSGSGVIGRPADDARDLGGVIELALAQVRRRIDVTGVHLAGFSLGGLQAAWLAELDARERRIGFDRLLLVNPPVSLWRSAQILDDMFDRNVDTDPAAVQALLDRLLAGFAEIYTREDDLNLDGDFLYRAHAVLRPSDAALETLIGIAFRFAAANLIFVSDVMSHSGYMVATDAQLGPTTSLTSLFIHAVDQSFDRYIDGIYVPYFRKSEPGFDKPAAIAEASLEPVADFLRGNPRAGMITNRDDIILDPGDLAWLEAVFGQRATILPSGGHGGNFQRRDFVDAVARFFRG
jgi:pimeloyl-ACP methyl ester carboxylesterase